MMRGTPRTFVGPVVFLLDGPVDPGCAEKVTTGLGRLPGITACEVDVGSGAVVVTAGAPADRADVEAVLERLGWRLRRG